MKEFESFYDVIKKRRSVRTFNDQLIDRDKIDRVLECGLKAPSHDHMREWHFIFLKDAAIRKKIVDDGKAFSKVPGKQELDEMLADMDNEHQRSVYRYSIPIQEKMLLSAPELMLVCFRMKKELKECKSLYDLNSFASAWMVIENMLLAMAAEGLYGVTMVPFATSEVKCILEMPEDMEIAAFIPFGYPAKEHAVRQIKKDTNEVVHINKW